VEEAKKRYLAAQRTMPPKRVEDYVFINQDGKEVHLSELFGGKNDLIVIHNMGIACPYCTLWADGLNGLTDHFNDRAGFVLVNKDDLETQKKVKAERGWRFNMVSSKGSSFNRDLGFEQEDGAQLPGFSTFHKNPDGTIDRICFDMFGPGDDYCAVWPIFDRLADGPNDWEPKYRYP